MYAQTLAPLRAEEKSGQVLYVHLALHRDGSAKRLHGQDQSAARLAVTPHVDGQSGAEPIS